MARACKGRQSFVKKVKTPVFVRAFVFRHVSVRCRCSNTHARPVSPSSRPSPACSSRSCCSRRCSTAGWARCGEAERAGCRRARARASEQFAQDFDREVTRAFALLQVDEDMLGSGRRGALRRALREVGVAQRAPGPGRRRVRRDGGERGTRRCAGSIRRSARSSPPSGRRTLGLRVRLEGTEPAAGRRSGARPSGPFGIVGDEAPALVSPIFAAARTAGGTARGEAPRGHASAASPSAGASGSAAASSARAARDSRSCSSIAATSRRTSSPRWRAATSRVGGESRLRRRGHHPPRAAAPSSIARIPPTACTPRPTPPPAFSPCVSTRSTGPRCAPAIRPSRAPERRGPPRDARRRETSVRPGRRTAALWEAA